MFEWPNLVEVLRGIRWAVVGAVAARRYMPERATRDLDVVILARDKARVTEKLESAGYQRVGDLTIGGSTWKSPDGIPVDVIEARERWWRDALDDASRNLDASGAPALTAPYLILSKLFAGRVQDVADVTRMLGAMNDVGIEEVRAVLLRHQPDFIEDFESLVFLGRLENT